MHCVRVPERVWAEISLPHFVSQRRKIRKGWFPSGAVTPEWRPTPNGASISQRYVVHKHAKLDARDCIPVPGSFGISGEEQVIRALLVSAWPPPLLSGLWRGSRDLSQTWRASSMANSHAIHAALFQKYVQFVVQIYVWKSSHDNTAVTDKHMI